MTPYRLIDEEGRRQPVSRLCRTLGVTWRRGQMRAAGAVHHSDQGSQYTSFAFTRRLAAEGIVASMARSATRSTTACANR